MIHILFVAGSFGTTIQFVIHQFIKEHSNKKITNQNIFNLVLDDGSMHSVRKTAHYWKKQQLDDFFDKKIDQDILVTTPLYPLPELHADEIIKLFTQNRPHDQYIFVTINDIESAELVILAQYYKIATGAPHHQKTKEIFAGSNQKDIVNWDSRYTHWSQMQNWEFREWFSLFYTQWVQEWINAKQYINPNWYTVSVTDILNHTHETFLKMVKHFGTLDEAEFDEFIKYWRSKQQYLIDERDILDKIVDSVISQTPYTWKDLNLISEAMIQKKLRDQGYEIKCYNLNKFPTNSEDLFVLLEKNETTRP